LGDRAVVAAATAPRLTVLHARLCPRITDASLLALEARSELRALSLSGCSRLSSAGVASLLESCSGVQELDLAGCSRLSDAALAPLLGERVDHRHHALRGDILSSYTQLRPVLSNAKREQLPTDPTGTKVIFPSHLSIAP